MRTPTDLTKKQLLEVASIVAERTMSDEGDGADEAEEGPEGAAKEPGVGSKLKEEIEEEVAEHFEETVAYHKAIGNKTIIIPGCDLSTQEKLDEFVKMANEFQPKLAAEGIRFGYHNHAHEFRANEDGSMIYQQILERTTLDLEIDTYWAFVGGNDPVEMMERLKDRLIFIHIKDGDPEGHGTPLGMGQAPCKAVYKKAVEMGVPMVVESETCTPDGPTEARICIEFLKAQEEG